MLVSLKSDKTLEQVPVQQGKHGMAKKQSKRRIPHWEWSVSVFGIVGKWTFQQSSTKPPVTLLTHSEILKFWDFPAADTEKGKRFSTRTS